MVARRGVLCEQESRTSLKRSIPMTGEAMRLLRRRMIDMTIRDCSDQKDCRQVPRRLHPRKMNDGTGGLEMQ